MGSICRCLFRCCCASPARDSDDDDDDHSSDHAEVPNLIQSYSSVSPYVQPVEGRGLISSSSSSRTEDWEQRVGDPTATTETQADDDDHDVCCRPYDPNAPSLYNFIRRNMNKWHNPYGAVMDADGEDHRDTDYLSSKTNKKKLASSSPLRQAVSFNSNSSCDLPCTINADEIVLPGSMIQQQMAQQMIRTANITTIQTNVEECVICMEPFDASNPRMPTLCNCGVNKTYFHLPCLYQWIEQSMECPSCRTKITWEEF
jgi:hypothetical protein